MKSNFFYTLLITTLISSSHVYAQTWTKRCPITGIVPLKQYVTRSQYRCYSKQAKVVKLGLTQYLIPRSSRSTSRASIPVKCGYMTVKNFPHFFPQKNLRCFKSAKEAIKNKYAKFDQKFIPESAFPTPTPTPVVGSPIRIDKGVMNFTFPLGEHVPGSGYRGDCTAVLNGIRTTLSVTCTHNVTGATEAHLHVVPHNERSCDLASPPSPFTLECAITDEQAASIEQGYGLIAIHLAPDVDGQAAAGLIRND